MKMTPAITRLATEQLYRSCDPASLTFDSTAQLPDTFDMPGQDRAIAAIRFGVGMPHTGFNLFVMGNPGAGRRGLISRFLDTRAPQETAPDNWCYVNNFSDATKPLTLRLPHGQGAQLRDDMQLLVKELQTTIPAMFEGEEYRSRVDQIDAEFNELQKSAFIDLAKEAEKQSIALLRTPEGFSFAAEKNGEVLSNEDYEKLTEEEKAHYSSSIAILQKKLEKLLQQVLDWRKEHHNRLRQLNQEVTIFAWWRILSSGTATCLMWSRIWRRSKKT